MHTKVSLGFDFPVGDPKQCTTVKIFKIPRFQNTNVTGHFSVSDMSWM